MGFSLTGTHVVYFVASVIIAGAVSGVFITVTNDIVSSLSDRGNRIQENLDVEFKVINDPDNIPVSGGDYIFYLKNIGEKKITTSTSTFTVFIDGELISSSNYSFSTSSINVGKVTNLSIAQSEISSGDHVLKVVGPQDIEDKFNFKI
ncbi:MAG: flagellar protein G [Candidatus Thermoplasmatota archaeon]